MPAVTRAANPEEELSTDETRISLRVKVPLEDGTAVVEMTGPAVPENGLQAFGDWVLAALEQHADGAAEAARLMIAALRQRDWEGDDVLADGAVGDQHPAWPGPQIPGMHAVHQLHRDRQISTSHPCLHHKPVGQQAAGHADQRPAAGSLDHQPAR